MEERKYRIGHVADELHVETFVIRFWEKEFGLGAHRSQGGQRFYTQKDITRFKLIKELLYEKGFTIAGAKKCVAGEKKVYASTPLTSTKKPAQELDQVNQKIVDLQKRLLKLRELLS